MKNIHITTAGELLEALEKAIAEGNNPNTPEKWGAFLDKMAQDGGAECIGAIPDDMDADLLAANMREEGIKAKSLNQLQKKEGDNGSTL